MLVKLNRNNLTSKYLDNARANYPENAIIYFNDNDELVTVYGELNDCVYGFISHGDISTPVSEPYTEELRKEMVYVPWVLYDKKIKREEGL